MDLFFCGIAVPVQERFNCPELLKSRHDHTFLVEASFMGMTAEKEYRGFLQFLWFCSAVLLSKR